MKKNKAEKKVRELLIEEGFQLDTQRDERAKGVDVVAMKDGEVLLIEVKEAKLHSRAWQVDAVSAKQKITCTTIAIVTPYGIIVQPMRDHLKLCANTGVRYMTETIGIMRLRD